MKLITIIKVNESGIVFQSADNEIESSEKLIDWRDILEANAFKRDLLSIDLICLQLRTIEDEYEVNEDDPCWAEFVEDLPRRLKGFEEYDSWFSKVAHPAFEPSLSTVFKQT